MRKFPDVGQLQNVLLSDPMDNTFAIKVRSEASKLLFAEGFKDICQAHNIADIVRVHYTYTGTGHFNIRIFYDEITEVNYQVLEDPVDDDDEDFADHDDGYFAWLNVLTKPMATDGQVLVVYLYLILFHILYTDISLPLLIFLFTFYRASLQDM